MRQYVPLQLLTFSKCLPRSLPVNRISGNVPGALPKSLTELYVHFAIIRTRRLTCLHFNFREIGVNQLTGSFPSYIVSYPKLVIL